MLSVCVHLPLREMSAIAWTANGLWPYWAFGRMSLPFVPSHTFCDPPTLENIKAAHIRTKRRPWKCGWDFLETVASAHEETCHSGQAYTHLPSGEETSLKVIVGQKCCLLVVCFLAFLPNLSSLFLALMKQTSHSTLCLLLHTCQILPTRPRIIRQGLIGPWKLKIFEK